MYRAILTTPWVKSIVISVTFHTCRNLSSPSMAIWIAVTSLHLIWIQSSYWKVGKHAPLVFSLISLTSNKVSNYTVLLLMCWTRNKEILAFLFTNPLGFLPVTLQLSGQEKTQGGRVMRPLVLLLKKERVQRWRPIPWLWAWVSELFAWGRIAL